MSELKPLPCPFCGGAPQSVERPDNIDGTRFFYALACYCGGYSACAHKMAVEPTPEQAKRTAIEAWNRRAQPAQVGQVPELTSTEVNDACWAFVEALPHQLPGAIFNDLKPAIYAAICKYLEQAVLAKRVPMTESAWQNPLHLDQLSDKPIPNWTPLYRLMSKISDPSNAQHFSAEAAAKAFGIVGEKGGA